QRRLRRWPSATRRSCGPASTHPQSADEAAPQRRMERPALAHAALAGGSVPRTPRRLRVHAAASRRHPDQALTATAPARPPLAGRKPLERRRQRAGALWVAGAAVALLLISL